MRIVDLSVALEDNPGEPVRPKLENAGCALPGERGFRVSCLPVKITGASAGWCRAVAMVDA